MWMMFLILGYPTIAFFWATVARMASFLVAQLASHDHVMIFIGIWSNFIPLLLYLLTKLVFPPITQFIGDNDTTHASA
ncbi:hypothetical protein K438DRAFT_1962948 [Mycena galopus ATCC 62051]|nr:hypothetical protein K438DRAFT_1962948 [Mycena galopus ATCC 62051]